MKKPGRRSIRLQRYDYSSAGYYFVTICSINREEIFGKIVVGADVPVRPNHAGDNECEIELSEIGKVVEYYLLDIDNRYSNVYIDKYCIMPNHIHAIVVISNVADGGGQGRPPLPQIIQGLKSMTARMN